MDKISFDLGILSAIPRPYCIIDCCKDANTEVNETEEQSKLQETPKSPTGLANSPLTCNSDLFGHLIDEILAFEAKLDGLCYPAHALRPVELLTRLDVLQHWLCLESEVSYNRMHNILSKKSAWCIDNPEVSR